MFNSGLLLDAAAAVVVFRLVYFLLRVTAGLLLPLLLLPLLTGADRNADESGGKGAGGAGKDKPLGAVLVCRGEHM